MKKKVYAYLHTHWDREWYLPFSRYQVKLVRLMDKVISLLETEKYPFYTLDGQTAMIEDYLEERTEVCVLEIWQNALKMGEFSKPSKTRIKWKENQLELVRQGAVGTHMIFEENQIHVTDYATPYGSLLLGVNTKTVKVEEKEDIISILVEYRLELDGEVLSQNRLKIGIRPAN